MTPEDVDIYIGLGRELPRSFDAREAFIGRRRKLMVDVEALTPAQRMDRLVALIGQQVVHPHMFQSGKRGSSRRCYGETPIRVVESKNQQRYAVSMVLEYVKDNKQERVCASAEWRNISNSTYFDTVYTESVDNSWLQDPNHVSGLRSLADLEWTLGAYLSGNSLEDA